MLASEGSSRSAALRRRYASGSQPRAQGRARRKKNSSAVGRRWQAGWREVVAGEEEGQCQEEWREQMARRAAVGDDKKSKERK